MKALRVVKTILLIATIIALAIPAAGSVFIMRDKCKYNVSADEISAKLDEYKFEIGSVFKAVAEGEGEAVDDFGADLEGSDEADDWGDEGEGDADLKEPSGEPEFTADPNNDWSLIVPADYTLEGNHKYGFVLGLMKAANTKIHLSFLDDLSFKFGDEELKNKNGEFQVNAFVLVAACCLTVASILHFISKKIGKKGHKTFWGVLLMVIGFISFLAVFALGQIIANFNPLNHYDFAASRIYTVAFFTFAALIVYLLYDRVGIRAMQVKNLKRRLARKER